MTYPTVLSLRLLNTTDRVTVRTWRKGTTSVPIGFPAAFPHRSAFFAGRQPPHNVLEIESLQRAFDSLDHREPTGAAVHLARC